MAGVIRNFTDVEEDMLIHKRCKYLIHDRGSKCCDHFDALLRSVNIEPVKLQLRSPNLNACAQAIRLVTARTGKIRMSGQDASLRREIASPCA